MYPSSIAMSVSTPRNVKVSKLELWFILSRGITRNLFSFSCNINYTQRNEFELAFDLYMLLYKVALMIYL